MKKIIILFALLFTTISLNGRVKYSIMDFKPIDIRESQLYFSTHSHMYGDKDESNYNYSEMPDSISPNYEVILSNFDNKSINFNSQFIYSMKRENKNNSFYSNSFLNTAIRKNRGTLDYEYFRNQLIYKNIYSQDINQDFFDIRLNSINSFNHYFTEKIGVSNDILFNLNLISNKREHIYLYENNDNYDSLFVNGNMVDILIQKRTGNNDDIDNDKRNSINIKYYTGSVFGRLYEGKYSAIAMELIDELKKDKLLESKPTNSQIKQLAKIIYEEKNRYYQDSRMKRKKQLKEIVSFLINNNLIEDSVMPILTINDIYNYSSASYSTDDIINGASIDNNLINYNRPFGLYGGIKVGGGYNEYNYFYEDIDPRNTKINTYYDSSMSVVFIDTSIDQRFEKINVRSQGNYDYSIKGFLTYGKPFGWHFHYVSNLTLESTFYKDKNYELLTFDDSEDYDSTLTPEVRGESRLIRQNYGSLYNQIQYFLNSRTVFSLNQRLEIYDRNYKFDEKIDYSYYMLELDNRISGEYYFTPSFHLYLSLNYDYKKYFDREHYILDNDNVIKMSVENYSRNSWNVIFGTYFYF
ncbi:MAG: hypothetical protein U9R41_02590 [Candidatus Marinimicrobia bacterium]|nr:hypothetical protein [Candidatus Neomarinimicrobiota bacterium]